MADCACLACQLGLGVACKETEARIRADARRFLLGELRALAADLTNPATRQRAVERLESLVESQPPTTEPPVGPSAKLEGPQAGLSAHAQRRISQLEARNEVLQEEVRRLRAQLNAKDAA